MATASRHLFCFGFGYCARGLAEALLSEYPPAEGWRISGTSRSDDTRDCPIDLGAEGHIFDRARPLANPAQALAGTTHLLVSVPPDSKGDPVLDQHAADIAALADLQWIGYLSTTGVYGDHGGGWVDESSALQPTQARSRNRVRAETAWRALGQRHDKPTHLFRLAGIYGPGRNALETVRRGTARRVVKPGQVFSRIHRDDIVQTLRASIAAPNPGAAYNLCDDAAAPPHEVVEYACELLGVPPPPAVAFEDAELSDMARSFYRDNKRVRNDRIKQELGVRLAWPTYREGLAGLLRVSAACSE